MKHYNVPAKCSLTYAGHYVLKPAESGAKSHLYSLRLQARPEPVSETRLDSHFLAVSGAVAVVS